MHQIDYYAALKQLAGELQIKIDAVRQDILAGRTEMVGEHHKVSVSPHILLSKLKD